jgi:hypothetical protein
VPAERTKPWGTAHAVLCAREAIHEPFAVINADDFYGREAFEKIARFLREDCNASRHSVVGYELSKTLSDNGSVSRGVCAVDDKGHLSAINERTKFEREGGRIFYEDADGHKQELPDNTPVSMNFWGFDPSIFELSAQLFKKFLAQNGGNPKAEFFIPIVVDEFIREGKGVVDVIPTSAQWFGVTYKEDAPGVKSSLQALINEGAYPEKLWS